MIKDKTITFGYGDILVGGKQLGYVKLEYIKPSQEIGLPAEGDYEVIETVVFEHKSDMYEFYKKLCDVSENNCIIEFRGYTLDFSHYNQKSVDVVRKAFLKASHCLALAC